MNTQKIKQIASIATLIAFALVGIGGRFGHEVLRARQENLPLWIMQTADVLRDIGDLLLIIAPAVLIIADWRNIFPALKKGDFKPKE